MTTDSPSEKRLEELREQAWKDGVAPGKGVDVAGGPIPRKPGYYGQPVVKPPVWTWEIPIYFFIGGLSGMSAVIASAAVLFHHVDLARTAIWLAAIGVILSSVLLIMDLGRPLLFINMLRVFKYQSWIWVVHYSSSTCSAFSNINRLCRWAFGFSARLAPVSFQV